MGANMLSLHEPYSVIDVTPTLNTNAFADGDALFNYQELPNAVTRKGGCSELVNITVTSKKADWTAMEIILMSNAQSLESANDPMSITAAEGAAAGFLGWVDMPSAGALDMGDAVFANPVPAVAKPKLPFLLQAGSSSTSVYFSAIIGGTVTFAASDLTFRFHIKHR